VRSKPLRGQQGANDCYAHNDRQKNIQVDRLGEARRRLQFLDCLTKVRVRREKQNSEGFESRVATAVAHERPATGRRRVEDQHCGWRLPHGKQTCRPITGNLHM
jgi:hypothetical protein